MDAPHSLLKLAKIVRAAEHAKALEGKVEEFFSGENGRVIPDYQTEPGYLVIRALVEGQFDPYWSVVIGEALYQLRSALDHLACHLVKENNQVVDKKVEFPIFLLRDDFRDPNTGNLRTRITDRIGKISLDQQAIIEEEQPFNRKDGLPEDDPLWILHELSNFDRHQDLHVVNTTIRKGRETFSPAWFAKRYFTQISTNYGRAFEGETEVARYRIAPAAYNVTPQIQVQVKADVTFDIAFGDKGPSAGTGRPVVSTLGAIGARVALLMGKFYV